MPDFALQSPQDNRVYRLSDQAEADRLVNMGYTQATPEQIKHEELLKSFDNWKGKLTAAGTALVDAVPGANALVAQFDDPAAVKYRQEQGQLAQEANPGWAGAGAVGGIVGSTLATAPVVGGLTSLATGAAAAAGAGTVGTFAAATGAAGLESVGLGKLADLDNAALQHSLHPEGQEKLAAEGGDSWRAFAIGAGAHVGFGALGLAFKGMAKLAKGFSVEQFRSQLVNNSAMQKTLSQATQDEVWKTAESLGVIGKKAPEARKVITRSLANVEAEMNEVKAATKGRTLNGPARRQAQAAVADALEGTPLGRRVNDWYRKDLSIQQLQDLRKKIYAHVDWGDPLAGHGPAYKDAGLYVGQQIRAVLAAADTMPGQVRAQQWAALDKEYNALSLLRDNLHPNSASSKAGNLNWISGALGWGALGTAAKVGFGAPGAGMVAAVAGARKLIDMYKTGGFATASKTLGNLFDGNARRLTTALEAGLFGVPQAVHAATEHENEYQAAAAQVAAIRNDPQKSYEQMQAAATSAGIPDDLAHPLVERKHAQLQYLGQQLPGRIGASELPTRAMPDPAAQRKWLGKLRTSEDPAYGFANPTSANMDILKRFYPGMVTTMQVAVHQHLQNNPDAPAEAKVWASRVLGRPVTPLASPTYLSLMAKLRQQEADAQAAPATKRSKGGSNASAAVESGMTRLEELSGG